MNGAIFDPRAFAADALALWGALVEDGLVLAPDALARELRVEPEFRLGDDGVPCGLGTPLLDGLVRTARARRPAGTAALELPTPKVGHAASLAGRFVVRNGVSEVGSTFGGDATYVAAHVAFVAEADDRHEGLVHVVANARDGAVPDAAFRALVDAQSPGDLLSALRDEPSEVDAALVQLSKLARARVAERVAEIAGSVERRHRRDHARIVEYFASLIAEARAPRRRQDPATIEAKIAHFVSERGAKLRELDTRYALRTALAPAAILVVRVPSVTVTLRVRRRKAERELSLRLPAGAQGLDALACEACGQPTSRPAVCDERVHVLCEACVPNAQGRPDCRACGGAVTRS